MATHRVQISDSTRTKEKYRGIWTTPSPTLSMVTLQLSPTGGAVELRSLHEGSFIRRPPKRQSYPQIPSLEGGPRERYRFEAGPLRTARLQLRSFPDQERGEGGGREPIGLESNPVEFGVLAGDAAWQARELASAVEDLGIDPAAHAQALHHLGLIDSPASISKLVSLFLADAAPRTAPAEMWRNTDRARA